MKIPELIDRPNMNAVIKAAQEHIEYMQSDGYHEDNDDAHYIFEAVLEACYGKDVWKWVNEKMG